MAKVEVSMPKMGESITEGTVIEWLKKPGDTIELDEPLLEIGTDKVDTEVPSPAAGVLKEIKVEAGETVDVGSIIAIIETEQEAGDGDGSGNSGADDREANAPPSSGDGASAESQTMEASGQAASGASAETKATSGASADTKAESGSSDEAGSGEARGDSAEQIDVLMPKMGESIMEGTVLSWLKQVGDEIDLDEPLLEIATDKVDTEVPSPAKGTVQEILVGEGDTVDVGTRIAVIGAGAGAPKAPEGGPAPKPVDKAPADKTSEINLAEQDRPAAQRDQTKPSQAPQVSAGDGGNVPRSGPNGEFFSPLVRAIAEKEGISVEELSGIKGSGREGRITKNDVLSWLDERGAVESRPAPGAQPKAQPSAKPADRPAASTTYRDDDRVEVIKMDRMRQIIAEHMIRSKSTSAHVTSFAEIDVTNLVRLRERNKDAFLRKEGIKLTYTPFFVYAAVEALRDHPILNASVEGNEIIVRKDFHIGIAVAIGKSGLVAPVIRLAGQKNVSGLAHAAADLAERARSKQLLPDQLQGGTFTVTNVGSLGSIMGTPIINQPQVGILATGAIKKRAVVMEDPKLGDMIAIRHMMFVSLSYDHRIVDGAMSASFLQRYTEVLESIDPDGEVK